MAKATKNDEVEIVVAIDTREQLPYSFAKSETKTLITGDYSVVGFEDRVSVERKSKEDGYGSLGAGRERFERELERLGAMEYAAIVVESTLRGFLVPPTHSSMRPKSALLSIVAWSVKYGVPVFFADDRAHGNALTYRLLQYFVRYHGVPRREEGAAVGSK